MRRYSAVLSAAGPAISAAWRSRGSKTSQSATISTPAIGLSWFINPRARPPVPMIATRTRLLAPWTDAPAIRVLSATPDAVVMNTRREQFIRAPWV